MAAPNLALRNCFYVNYIGTDDPGYNAIGKPWSYATVGAALAALALVANPPSGTNPWYISIGPGVFTDTPQLLPPWVWIVGSPDGDGDQTVLNMNFALSPAWATGNGADLFGGFSNVQFGSGRTLDLTLPVPISSGNRTVQILNLSMPYPDITWNATGAGATDNISIRDSVIGNSSNPDDGSANFYGGNITLQNVVFFAGQIGFGDSTASDTNLLLYGVYCATSDQIYIQALYHNLVVVLSGCRIPSVEINEDAPSGVITEFRSDVISLPNWGNIAFPGSFDGTGILLSNDAHFLGYTPTVPSNWPLGLADVQAALDALGSGAAGTTSAPVEATAAGTAYNLTATPAQLTFGTTSPVTGVLNRRGTWLIWGTVVVEFAGATFAASRTVSFKLRRTNNTPTDVPNSNIDIITGIVTGLTGTLAVVAIPPTSYITGNTNDLIGIFGSVSVVPTAGNLQCTAPGTKILAIRTGN